MSLLSRQKGKRGEREIVQLARAHGLRAEQTWQLVQSANPAERRSDVLIAGRRSKPDCQL